MNQVFDAFHKIGQAMAECELVAEIARLDEAMRWYHRCEEGTQEQRSAHEAMQAASKRCIEISRAASGKGGAA